MSRRTRQRNAPAHLANETVSSVSSKMWQTWSTYKELHFRNLLVNLLHKLDDEVHQLMLKHLLGMEVGDQEGDVVAL